MPAFNFQTRFADAVECGTKCTTIRARNAVVGTTAHLFTGMRTKACKRLGKGVIIGCLEITLGFKQNGSPRIYIRSKLLNEYDSQILADVEGFSDARDMVNWFKDTYKQSMHIADGGIDHFKGHLIAWIPEHLTTSANLPSKRAAKTPVARQTTGAWDQLSTSLARIPKQ